MFEWLEDPKLEWAELLGSELFVAKLFYINVRLPLFVQGLNEILDIKFGLAYKEKQANLS